jgi:hypothetical protein
MVRIWQALELCVCESSVNMQFTFRRSLQILPALVLYMKIFATSAQIQLAEYF